MYLGGFDNAAKIVFPKLASLCRDIDETYGADAIKDLFKSNKTFLLLLYFTIKKLKTTFSFLFQDTANIQYKQIFTY